MNFFSLLWIFFIIISLQPIIHQRMLDMKRLQLLSKMENKRNSRVIALIHRQETMSFLGFPSCGISILTTRKQFFVPSK